MEKKGWWRSKTLWVNLVAFAALGVQSQCGFIIDAQTQGAILAVVNLVLRCITKEPIGLKTDAE